MLKNNPDQDWEEFGKTDPYYGVISMKDFHRDALTPEALERFFLSGKEHIDWVLHTIREAVAPGFQPKTALDFGCGVGRCTIPLAAHCEKATGADVSPSMLEEARRNAEQMKVLNIEWAKSDDQLAFPGAPFDLVHCFIVFQHIPPSRGERLFEGLIDALASGGVGAVQFLFHKEVSLPKRVLGELRRRFPPAHILANLLFGHPWNYPLMQKNAYDLNRLCLLLRRKGCGHCAVRFEGTGAFQSAVLFFQKKPDDVPYDVFYQGPK